MAGEQAAPGAVAKRRATETSDEFAWTSWRPRRRVLLTYGAFDAVEDPRQMHILRHLASLCDALVVGCASDALLAARGTPARHPFSQRRRLLDACPYVSRVITEDSETQKRSDIVNNDIAIFAMAQEWAGQFDDLQDLTQVIYLAGDAPDRTVRMI